MGRQGEGERGGGAGVNWNWDRKGEEKENEVKQTGTEGRRRELGDTGKGEGR